MRLVVVNARIGLVLGNTSILPGRFTVSRVVTIYHLRGIIVVSSFDGVSQENSLDDFLIRGRPLTGIERNPLNTP